MKTLLPTSINTVKEATAFLTALYNNKESFHPEDDATDLSDGLFTKDEGDQLNKLMADIYNLEENAANHATPIFDPCQFLLELNPEYSKKD